MGTTRRRTVIPLSLSPSNPDAQIVAEALAARGVQPGQRSRAILAWAAAYLMGQQLVAVPDAEAEATAAFGMTAEQIEACLDDF